VIVYEGKFFQTEEPMGQIRIAIAGVGNCASALIQGLEYYKVHPHDDTGLLYPTIGGYAPADVVPVAAFDVDGRKVDRDLSEAIFAAPNCTLRFQEVPPLGVPVRMGPRLDGVPPHLAPFVSVASEPATDIARILRDSNADLLVNLLPTGSTSATRAYADAALKVARVGFINGIPEMIASDPSYAEAATASGVVLVGDDFKSQIGTTIVHRSLIHACVGRGVRITRMYQYNYAGNTDFANLEYRGESKEVTKRSALRALLPNDVTWGLAPMFINGQDDTKTGVIHIEGRYWGGQVVKLDARLEVNDSADAGGVLIDMIRFAKVAAERGLAGVLSPVCAYYSKHPPVEIPDDEAKRVLDDWASEPITPRAVSATVP
jgi:myo-inositol-1-phosphate synthase